MIHQALVCMDIYIMLQVLFKVQNMMPYANRLYMYVNQLLFKVFGHMSQLQFKVFELIMMMQVQTVKIQKFKNLNI